MFMHFCRIKEFQDQRNLYNKQEYTKYPKYNTCCNIWQMKHFHIKYVCYIISDATEEEMILREKIHRK